MSLFTTTYLACPACGTAVDFPTVHSVNADRRPDLRDEILAETFQARTCPKCAEVFRLDPEFNLLDIGHGQWIAAAPLANLPQWQATEVHARSVFELAFGPQATPAARELGANLQRRITFGWHGLREKLLAHDNGLDDVTLELCKAAIMRSTDSPLAGDTELRLLAVSPEELTFAWLLSASGELGPALRVARSLYEEIAADVDGVWGELRNELSVGLFVDLNRLLIPQTASNAALAM